MEDVHRVLHPQSFQSRFIAEGINARDGRSIVRCRSTSLATNVINSAAGSCFGKIGQTTVVTGIKCQVGAPAQQTPTHGVLEVNVELGPLCSSAYKIGKPSDEALALSRFLTRAILRSGMIDLNQLCIEAGKAVWVLKADVVCLDHDGNVEDAALLSLCGALRSLKLPKPTFNERTGLVTVSASEEDSSSLVLLHDLVPLTCVIAAGELVVDPSADVERVSSTKFTVVYSTGGQLCGVYKPGRAAISVDTLRTGQSLCKQRLEQLKPLFSKLKSTTA